MAYLRRPLATYEACKPDAVASGSQAQMMKFVDDAQADIASLAAALGECQQVLAMMIAPEAIKTTTVVNAYAQAVAADVKARALIGAVA
jgi:hypothetical protein